MAVAVQRTPAPLALAAVRMARRLQAFQPAPPARRCRATCIRRSCRPPDVRAAPRKGTVLNFIPAFSYFSTEAITCIVICALDVVYIHYFSDASINVTGGIGMFAGCCIQQLALRMHLQSPCAHTSEIVAVGTNVHAIVPVNGILQELGIRRGRPTTTNFDSASTVFVATSDAAPKKSV